MNLFRGYNKSGRKPHFWSQFLLGMLAILSLPLEAASTQHQQIYAQAYQQAQQLEQQKPQAQQFYQQQQIQQQQRISQPHVIFIEQPHFVRNPIDNVPPIRAGPHFFLSI